MDDLLIYSKDRKTVEGVQDKTITSITIPYGVTSIGGGAFMSCSKLESITIPNSVKSIGDVVFMGCSQLTSIHIPSSVESIGICLFEFCSNLHSITISKDNPTYDSRNNCNAIIETATNKLTNGCKNTTIPDSVTSIGQYAFAYCSSLSSINIPDSVTSIGKYAFAYCSSLTSINIPNSVTSIGKYAF